jgi:hypothetical protein
MNKENKELDKDDKALVSRREALEKAGKYAVFTATAAIMLLSPKKAVAGSEPSGPGWGNNYNRKPVNGPPPRDGENHVKNGLG